MFRRNNFTKALSLIFLLAILWFIWGNSLMTGADSSNMSGRVVALLEKLFGPATNLEKVTFYVRKLAHMSEFAALGFVLGWFWYLWQKPGKETFSLPLLCGLTTACIDETIQLFTPDRGSSLRDVWIDMAGFLLAFLLYRFLSAPARRRDREKLEQSIEPRQHTAQNNKRRK